MTNENKPSNDPTRPQTSQQQLNQQQHLLTHMTMLYKLTHSLIRVSGLSDRLQSVTENVAALLPAQRVVLYTFDQSRRQVTRFIKGGPKAHLSEPTDFEGLWQGLTGWAAREKKPAISPKRLPDPRESAQIQADRKRQGAGSIIVAPLIFQDMVIGTLTALNGSDDPDFSQDDVELLMAVAGLTAVAIHDADLYQSLNQSENRFQALFDAASIGILITGEDGKILLANDELLSLFGYESAELVGQKVETLLPNRFQKNHHLHRANFFTNPHTRPMGSGMTLFGRQKNGREFPVEVSLSTLDMGGEQVALAYVVDISVRREAEHEAAQRTEELRRSNEELEQFAYVISHDLRAPLRALHSYSQFLREDYQTLLDEEGVEYLEGIAESAQQMEALITGLLEYARIGRTVEAQSLVSLRDLVEKIIRHNQFEETAVIHLPANNPAITASPLRLEQVFTNLLSNAVKFRQPGQQAEIWIHWEARPSHWQISIRDNGIGIAEKHLQKIFGVFQRLHTADEYEGTGIGLSIVKKAVADMGGRIVVSSTPGQGTTFSFTLPTEETTT